MATIEHSRKMTAKGSQVHRLQNQDSLMRVRCNRQLRLETGERVMASLEQSLEHFEHVSKSHTAVQTIEDLAPL